MDLSIIIVSWNTRDLLVDCLQSIYAHPPLCEFEVWVVDNASSDGSEAAIRDCFRGVELIENQANTGFAHANNQAIRRSSGQYVLLLNSDTIVGPDALNVMVKSMEAHPDAGIVGGSILNADGSPQFSYGRFPSLLSETASAWGIDNRCPISMKHSKQRRPDREVMETDWVMGAAMMVRREVLDRVGLLDESYFMYSEEIDLAYRARRGEWKIYVLRDARIVHLGQQSSKQAPAAMKAQLFRSKVLYFQKHHGRLPASILQLVFQGSMLARCLMYRLRGKTILSQMWSATWKCFSSPSRDTGQQLVVP
jgi:N-acetylglucosaminyl-diphospho-decaprenol L-rhamnosyltransferase